eukprot:COSAG04_NODE_1215_length_7713_cov_6.145127_1_plen_395_part_00
MAGAAAAEEEVFSDLSELQPGGIGAPPTSPLSHVGTAAAIGAPETVPPAASAAAGDTEQGWHVPGRGMDGFDRSGSLADMTPQQSAASAPPPHTAVGTPTKRRREDEENRAPDAAPPSPQCRVKRRDGTVCVVLGLTPKKTNALVRSVGIGSNAHVQLREGAARLPPAQWGDQLDRCLRAGGNEKVPVSQLSLAHRPPALSASEQQAAAERERKRHQEWDQHAKFRANNRQKSAEAAKAKEAAEAAKAKAEAKALESRRREHFAGGYVPSSGNSIGGLHGLALSGALIHAKHVYSDTTQILAAEFPYLHAAIGADDRRRSVFRRPVKAWIAQTWDKFSAEGKAGLAKELGSINRKWRNAQMQARLADICTDGQLVRASSVDEMMTALRMRHRPD